MKELEPLEALSTVAATLGLRVTLIGALARQIMFDTPYSNEPYRLTSDVDATVRVEDLDEFERLAASLVATGEFKRDGPHRFTFRGETELDLIPFGGIANADGNLEWPDGRVMSLDGLASADAHAVSAPLLGVEARVVNLPNLLSLKLFAYRDRGREVTKDIDDLMYIFSNSSESFEARLYAELEGETIQRFDYEGLGPYLLGRDVTLVVTPSERTGLIEILDTLLLVPPDYFALGRSAKGARLDRTIALFQAFRAGLAEESSGP